PDSDAAARARVRELLPLLAAGGFLDAVRSGDLRGLCLAREALAGISPLADVTLAVQALVATTLQRAGWTGREPLERILDGRAIGAFAMTETEAGSDAAAMQTTAKFEDGSWVLDGEKHLISNAGLADPYLIFAVTTPGAGSAGISAFLVPAATGGLTWTAQEMMAPHPVGRVRLRACRVREDSLVGPVDGGFRLGMMTLDRLRASVGASACGMAARALTLAIQHASTRRQFNAPIAAFQIVREKVGRLAAELEAARLLVYRAACHADRGLDGLTLEAAMAKSVATETAQRVVDESVQIAGGVGLLAGHPLERLYRSVRALRIYEGTTEIQRLIIARELLDE
ncbi:MAG: acyl-CoA dehydrogenase, partial [Acidimicrobiia bacterium]|nr:acyl-CoA dehydrogenase [Acidimicrobiia bacterium]